MRRKARSGKIRERCRRKIVDLGAAVATFEAERHCPILFVFIGHLSIRGRASPRESRFLLSHRCSRHPQRRRPSGRIVAMARRVAVLLTLFAAAFAAADASTTKARQQSLRTVENSDQGIVGETSTVGSVCVWKRTGRAACGPASRPRRDGPCCGRRWRASGRPTHIPPCGCFTTDFVSLSLLASLK